VVKKENGLKCPPIKGKKDYVKTDIKNV